MNTINIHIGIDPDVDKSGFAIYDSKNKWFNEISTLSFWDLIEEIDNQLQPFEVVIEAGWIIQKSNWHGAKNQAKTVGEKIAKSVGRNHQVGILIAEYCKKNNIPCRLIQPQGKITNATFKAITKINESTNQEERDAAMLVFQAHPLK